MVHRNLLITMLLGGLWHGANWTFVFWGGYHGLMLSLYKLCGERWDRLPSSLRRAATFLLVVVGWVFFRADSFGMAWALLQRMFSWSPTGTLPGLYGLLLALGVAAAIAHFAPNSFELKQAWRPWAVAAFGLGYAAALLVIASGQQSPFLYFQF